MSLIRRSGGAVVSRGSLASLQNAKTATPEDLEWEKKILAVASGLADYFDEVNLDMEIVSRLWGIYKRAEPEFNDEYFKPSGR